LQQILKSNELWKNVPHSRGTCDDIVGGTEHEPWARRRIPLDEGEPPYRSTVATLHSAMRFSPAVKQAHIRTPRIAESAVLLTWRGRLYVNALMRLMSGTCTTGPSDLRHAHERWADVLCWLLAKRWLSPVSSGPDAALAALACPDDWIRRAAASVVSGHGQNRGDLAIALHGARGVCKLTLRRTASADVTMPEVEYLQIDTRIRSMDCVSGPRPRPCKSGYQLDALRGTELRSLNNMLYMVALRSGCDADRHVQQLVSGRTCMQGSHFIVPTARGATSPGARGGAAAECPSAPGAPFTHRLCIFHCRE
jgi:hypothetical protein